MSIARRNGREKNSSRLLIIDIVKCALNFKKQKIGLYLHYSTGLKLRQCVDARNLSGQLFKNLLKGHWVAIRKLGEPYYEWSAKCLERKARTTHILQCPA